jgi:hypothetical protein
MVISFSEGRNRPMDRAFGLDQTAGRPQIAGVV